MPELGKGCVARFNSPGPSAAVIEDYRAAGVRSGWTPATAQPAGHAIMHKSALTIDVWVNTGDDRGMYVMRVYRAGPIIPPRRTTARTLAASLAGPLLAEQRKGSISFLCKTRQIQTRLTIPSSSGPVL